MRAIIISDTHGLHHQLHLPPGDLLIHTGDVSNRGTQKEVQDFLAWFSAQPHPHKIFIAGNHDFYFESATPSQLQAELPSNITYLKENGCQVQGINIWGSPITPIPRRRWAFNRERGDDIQPSWDLIPENLDIFMVHGPAKNILDFTLKKEAVGCQNLYDTLLQKRPRVVIFGHIHEARGVVEQDGMLFINASSIDRYGTKVWPPFVLDLAADGQILAIEEAEA